MYKIMNHLVGVLRIELNQRHCRKAGRNFLLSEKVIETADDIVADIIADINTPIPRAPAARG
ncbi:MAG TPA: hypothetical protein DCL15_11540 [Chloroflexi bacterium]|nr:hypothetical protein [Chloroflexota bacterium]